jgi:hypothetical protein
METHALRVDPNVHDGYGPRRQRRGGGEWLRAGQRSRRGGANHEGYRARWAIEEYFKAVKTGCAYERDGLSPCPARKGQTFLSDVTHGHTSAR